MITRNRGAPVQQPVCQAIGPHNRTFAIQQDHAKAQIGQRGGMHSGGIALRLQPGMDIHCPPEMGEQGRNLGCLRTGKITGSAIPADRQPCIYPAIFAQKRKQRMVRPD